MSIYERIAVAGNLVKTEQLARGDPPRREFVACFHYTNGLVVEYSGSRWTVVQEPK